MKRRKTEPDSQPAQEQGEAGSNDEQPFFGLPNELACLIWCKLDQQSQHRFMCASRQVAKNPVILAQIQYLSCYAERNDPLYQLSSFPSQAQLRRLKVVSSSPEVTAQFVQAAAGSQRAQTLLGRVHELRFEERVSRRAGQRNLLTSHAADDDGAHGAHNTAYACSLPCRASWTRSKMAWSSA